MNKQISLFLKNNYSTEPLAVDRILVSAFVTINHLTVEQNVFLKNYIIPSTKKKDQEILLKFRELLTKHKIQLDIEGLIELFEFVISPEDKIITGAVYTPARIREYILDQSFAVQQDSDVRVADISCGCGGFLYNAAQKIKKRTKRPYAKIFQEQLYGLDIQSYSVTRTKLLLSLLALSEGEDVLEFDFNLHVGNALDFQWNRRIRDFEGFDIIVGNPPYVCARNIPDESRYLLPNWTVTKTGHPDLYIPFFQIGMKNLKPGGSLGFITMNTFFKSVNGRALRAWFQDESWSFRLIDFGTFQVFRKKSTYTCICLIQKVAAKAISYAECRELEKLPTHVHDFIEILYSGLDAYKGWNLNQHLGPIRIIEKTGKPFKDRYKTRNGIATLKNDIYIFTPVKKDRRYYYLEAEEKTYPIEKSICKDIVNPNLLTTVEDLKKIRQKIIFPYRFRDARAQVLPEKDLQQKYPRAYAYLQTQKSILATRDKGDGKTYDPWFMYGRTQSLEKMKYKLFFPHISASTPHYLLNMEEDLLFYNGLAVIGESKDELIILRKLLSSRLFWFYIQHTSKPYGSSYFSLSKNYLKDFGVCEFTKDDRKYIRQENDKHKLDIFFEKKYQINLDMGSNNMNRKI